MLFSVIDFLLIFYANFTFPDEISCKIHIPFLRWPHFTNKKNPENSTKRFERFLKKCVEAEKICFD